MAGVHEVSVPTFPSSLCVGSEFIPHNVWPPNPPTTPLPGEAETICKLIRSALWPSVNNLPEGQLVLWNLKDQLVSHLGDVTKMAGDQKSCLFS